MITYKLWFGPLLSKEEKKTTSSHTFVPPFKVPHLELWSLPKFETCLHFPPFAFMSPLLLPHDGESLWAPESVRVWRSLTGSLVPHWEVGSIKSESSSALHFFTLLFWSSWLLKSSKTEYLLQLPCWAWPQIWGMKQESWLETPCCWSEITTKTQQKCEFCHLP